MTAYEKVQELVHQQALSVDTEILDLVKDDHLMGEIVCEVGEQPNAISHKFLPLSDCENPADIGLIRKMFEFAETASLVRDGQRKESLPRVRARQVKKDLQLRRVARRMRAQANRLKGDTKVTLVWAVKIPVGEHTKSLITVALEKDGVRYGYFFRLKTGLYLSGLY